MPKDFVSRSAPDCQLKKPGTPASFEALLLAVRGYSEIELSELEEDLTFYEDTGLIGVHMSRLLDFLNMQKSHEAA